MTDRRLIEAAFPLKQASLDSVHEKNVRHGHISTLHIWPARRPLAAARAALIAALLPDPGTPQARRRLLERIGGRVVETVERKRVGGRVVERKKEATEGGILHWGRENDPGLARLRREIRAAHGGRAPRVLDPFAGGGAIPLEAMRLGCEATAVDINPVAWFILKCTLDYPRRLAGETLPLPAFARADRGFMESFLEARGFAGGRGAGAAQIEALPADGPAPAPDLAWHVRAWGRRVLAEARKALAPRYPAYAEYAPLAPGAEYAPRPLRRLEAGAGGAPQLGPLNAERDGAYLADPRNPRWIAKPTVAYLWARTAACGNCRAAIPLLKTRWLCKKDNKRVLLTMAARGSAVAFGVERDVPRNGGNAAQSRAHDAQLGAGTMSRAGATCPCCGAVTPMADIRLEGRAGRLGAVLTAVVVDGPKGKEYRRPEDEELRAAEVPREELEALYAEIPFGLPEEPICAERPSPNSRGASGLPRYGLDTWGRIFTDRQLLALGVLMRELRRLAGEMDDYPDEWREPLAAYCAVFLSKLTDYGSALCSWHNSGEKLRSTFARFALPMVWDYCEVNPLSDTSGGFSAMADWVARYLDRAAFAMTDESLVEIGARSAIDAQPGEFDAIVTDPPYYDAIPYSDLMDFFHVWLRRALHGLSPEIDTAFAEPLGPKWDREAGDGELVDQPNRFDDDKDASKRNYEDGMARAFQACHAALKPEGRLVVVFANKSPDAWETLAAALIRAGFVVDASWPIQTEMPNKVAGGARLASSVWLVCRKRAAAARPGWDNRVLADMRGNVVLRLREFWDAGIRGPDFVWAATGPALEAFGRFPAVRKADAPGEAMTVSAFLREVRRMVVDFVVGRVLAPDGSAEGAAGLDDATAYYLLHRHDFGMGAAPAGACILYALSCNLSDSALAGPFDLLARTGARAGGGEDGGEESGAGGGGAVRLKDWRRRGGRALGVEGPGGRPAPLVDRAHKAMQLWRAGDRAKVDAYLESAGLWRDALFHRVLQALVELADAGSDERAVLESLSNHIAARQGLRPPRQPALRFDAPG